MRFLGEQRRGENQEEINTGKKEIHIQRQTHRLAERNTEHPAPGDWSVDRIKKNKKYTKILDRIRSICPGTPAVRLFSSDGLAARKNNTRSSPKKN
jgi:hypothetical protein